MNNRYLLIWAYLSPAIASILITVLLTTVNPLFLIYMVRTFRDHIGVFFTIIGLFTAYSLHFQTKILNEDNVTVLTILDKTPIRKEFKRASIAQFTILLVSIIIIFASLMFFQNEDVAKLSFCFSLFLILFEILLGVNNGIKYLEIRERILSRVPTNKK